MPVIKAMVPPDIPGTTSATPIAAPAGDNAGPAANAAPARQANFHHRPDTPFKQRHEAHRPHHIFLEAIGTLVD